ncbi:hypothetical protein WR25_12928 [Diploscapter pachys]|uniref:Dynamin GTPase n=1 Tax=Diploscapter pachys TaxID=2018661 RepID=A0A2A2LY85_9BILA|nr:hypothetical protein WR25_12928 [Diploscapter pachys]
MAETKFCADMSGVAEVYNLIINAATRFNMKGTSLPRIVVVGTESTGKTSLINRIVNKDFLPSGTGIVTRMPIKIGLVRTPLDDPRRKESKVKRDDWAEIEHDSKIYTDFNEVSDRLREIMNQQAGAGVSNTPIVVHVYSESALNLSLVDLPGLVINQIAGQEKNIPEQIERMVTSYISDPNTIILCVLPANVPPSNWKARNVVDKVDPSGERTLAALTQIDAMVDGTNANDALSGKDLKFKLGIIGVCNRSQRQLDNGISIDQTARLEQDYFSQNYPDFSNTCGIKYLIKRMNELLVKKIKADLPRLMTAFQNDLKKIERQLIDLGVREDITPENRSKKMFEIISDFSKEYEKLIQGGRAVLYNDEEAPCKKISDIFYVDFERELEIDHTKNLTPDRVKRWIDNAIGLTPKILCSSAPFIEVCKTETQRYCDPSVECVVRVHIELLDGIDTCTRNVRNVRSAFQMYPQIEKRFREIITELLSDYFEESKDLIEVYIESLASHISGAHPMFANAIDVESKKIRDGRTVKLGNFEKSSDKPSTNQTQPAKQAPGWTISRKQITSISQESEPGMLEEVLPHDQSNRIMNKINGNESNEVFSDPKNNLYHGAEQRRNEQPELMFDETTSLIMSLVPKYMSIVRRNVLDTVPVLIVSSMNRKLEKKLAPTLNQRLGSLSVAELEELFREEEKIATMRQQLESQRKELDTMINSIKAISSKNLD